MSNSPNFNILEKRLTQLRRVFLPKIIDPTKKYNKQQLDKTMAYTVLAHAEIEQYLEDICEEVAIRTFDEWNTSKRLNRSTVSLVSFYYSKKEFPEKLSLVGKLQITQRIEEAKNSLTTYIHSQNNGINEDSLIKMLFPVGLLETEIPPGWTDLMNEMSKKRGTAAHKTAGKVIMQIHPHSEYDRIRKITDGLKVIDNILCSQQFR